MNFNEFIFVLQFLVYISVFLITLYNVLNNGKLFDIKKGFILLILGLLSYFVALSITLTDIAANVDDLILSFHVIFNIQSAMLVLFFLFFIIQIFFYYRDEVTSVMQPRNSLKERRL